MAQNNQDQVSGPLLTLSLEPSAKLSSFCGLLEFEGTKIDPFGTESPSLKGPEVNSLGLGYGMCSLGAVQHDPTFPLCAWFGVAGVWGVARGWGLPEEKLRTQPRKPVVWGSRKDFVVDFSSKFSGLGSVAWITVSEVDSRLRIQRRPNLSKCS